MAKRVNKRFLTVLTVVVVVMAAGAFALSKYITSGDAQEYVARGDAAFDRAKATDDPTEAFENLQAAREAYGRALQINKGNPDVIVKFGDVHHHMARLDTTEIGKDVQIWDEALQIEPNYVPALERLLETAIEISKLNPSPQVYTRLADRAQALSRADESNARARIYSHVGVVGAWLAGKGIMDGPVQESLGALAELMEQHPTEAVVPSFIARANLRRAHELAAENDPASAQQHREKALAVYAESLKTQGENPEILFDYYEVLGFLAQSERDESLRAKRREEMNEVLAKAASLAKPEDPAAVDILIRQARVLAQQGKAAEAEQAMELLHEKRPADQRVRLELARYWRSNPAKQRAAMELLAKPLADDPSLAGFRALTMRGLEIKRLIDLTHVRIDAYADSAGGERGGLRQLIEDGYKRAVGISSDDDPEILKLRGRILLLDRNVRSTREAILAFQRAADKLEQAGFFDVELNVQLARAYQSVNQTGEARSILRKIVQRHPKYVTGRKLLLDLLVTEGQYKAMEPHIAALAEANPNDPDVARYRIILHATSDELDKAKELVKAFPQETDQQKLLKARLALIAREPETSIALIAPISEAELQGGDGQFPASNLLAQVYLREKRPEEAKRIIGAARAKLPADKGWQVLEAYAENRATPEELQKLNEMAIEAIEDPLTRALQRYRVLIEQQKPEEALGVLLEAERQMPEAGQVAELMFLHGLDFRSWELAERAATKLEKLDWDHAQGLYYRTRMRFARRDYEGALQSALELSRKVPEFARTWVMLGQAQQATGQFESAMTNYRRALDKQPDSFEALRGIVDCNIQLDRISVAREYIEKGMEIGVGSAYFGDLLKRLEERRGDPMAVTAQREKDVEQNPESLRARMALSENYLRVADALMSKNDQKGSLEHVEKAKTGLEEAIQKWPDEPQLYLQLADLMLRTGQVQEALAIADRLEGREKYKDRPEPYTLRSMLLERLGPEGVQKAEQAMQTAVERSNDSADLREALANFYARHGQLDKAIAIKAELFQASKDPILREELIQHQLSAGRFKEAEQLISEALSASANDVRLLSMLGTVRARQGDFDGAQQVLNQALKADPQYAPARYYLGMVYSNRGDIAAAINELQLAADLRPSDVATRLALADAYQMRNQPEQATKELELGLQASPTDKNLRQQLFRMYGRQQRWGQAERLLEEAKTHEALSSDPTWWQLESEMWAARGDARRTREAAEIAFKKAPMHSDVFYQYCAVLLRQGAYDEILKVTEAVQPQDRSWWMSMVRGMARTQQKDGAQGIAEFERAMSAVDTAGDDSAAERLVKGMTQVLGTEKVVNLISARRDVRWKILLAKQYQENRDWTNAVRTMDELMQHDLGKMEGPQKLKVLSIGGLVYHAAGTSVPGSLKKAEDAYIGYLKMLEGHEGSEMVRVQALNNLALLLAEHPESPNVSKALEYSQRAYNVMEETNRFNASIADTHGWVLVLSDRIEEAIPLLQAAAAKEPPIPDPFYHLGEAYMRKSMPEEAEKNLSRAKDLIKHYADKGAFIDPGLSVKVDAALAKVKEMPKSASAAGVP